MKYLILVRIQAPELIGLLMKKDKLEKRLAKVIDRTAHGHTEGLPPCASATAEAKLLAPEVMRIIEEEISRRTHKILSAGDKWKAKITICVKDTRMASKVWAQVVAPALKSLKGD